MSKQYKIRWKRSDEEELRRVVKNFNAKITRLEKKYPKEKVALPERVTVKQLKELINTRQDLKRELNALKRFSKRGAETIVIVPETDYNLKITKWQKTEMNRRLGIINRKRKKRLEEIADIDMTSRGEKLGYKKGELGMGRVEEIELTPMIAFSRTMTYTGLKKKFKNIMVESQSDYWNKRDLIMKESYIKSLENNFNPEYVKDIIAIIKDMEYGDFRKIYESEGGNFERNYPLNQQQMIENSTYLRSVWSPNRKGE